MSAAVHDTLIRIALVSLCQDPLWPLTADQHASLHRRMKDRTPFTIQERVRLKTPLLAWAKVRLGPEAYIRLERQFDEAKK